MGNADSAGPSAYQPRPWTILAIEILFSLRIALALAIRWSIHASFEKNYRTDPVPMQDVINGMADTFPLVAVLIGQIVNIKILIFMTRKPEPWAFYTYLITSVFSSSILVLEQLYFIDAHADYFFPLIAIDGAVVILMFLPASRAWVAVKYRKSP